MLPLVLDFALIILATALLLALVRLARGPATADRVVALDLMATIAVGFAAVYAIAWDAAYLLDIGVVVAIIAFVGTVAFARIVARGESR
jgi:multicomponent Na+:H+ antiporter subunit F